MNKKDHSTSLLSTDKGLRADSIPAVILDQSAPQLRKKLLQFVNVVFKQARDTSAAFQLLKATFAEQAEKISPVHKFQC